MTKSITKLDKIRKRYEVVCDDAYGVAYKVYKTACDDAREPYEAARKAYKAAIDQTPKGVDDE